LPKSSSGARACYSIARAATIGIIGPYPPPYGGRPVHIKRLIEHIEHENFKILVFDYTKNRNIKISEKVIILPLTGKLRTISNLIKMLFIVDIIHYQQALFVVGNWFSIAIVAFLLVLRKRVIISEHWAVSDLKRNYERSSWLKGWIIRFVLSRANYVIVTNDEVKSYILTLAFPSRKVVTIPSFIPPHEKDEDHNAVPPFMWNFISAHKPIIGLSASYIRIAEGVDVYGLDMAVELINRLKDKWPNIGLVVLLPDVNNVDYLNTIEKIIKNNCLENNILINTLPMEAYPVWKRIDIFVRPTTCDGSSISLLEALWFGIPVIASDCVNRPIDAVTFRCRDIDSFAKKTEMVLRNYREHKKKVKSITVQNNVKEIVTLYKHVLHL